MHGSFTVQAMGQPVTLLFAAARCGAACACDPTPGALCGTRLVAGLALSALEGQVAWGGRQGVGVPPSVEKAVCIAYISLIGPGPLGLCP